MVTLYVRIVGPLVSDADVAATLEREFKERGIRQRCTMLGVIAWNAWRLRRTSRHLVKAITSVSRRLEGLVL